MTFSVTEKRGTSRNIFTGRTFSARQNTNVPLEKSWKQTAFSTQTNVDTLCLSNRARSGCFRADTSPGWENSRGFPVEGKGKKRKKKISLDLPFLSPFLPSGRGKMFHPRRDFFPFGENRFSLSLFFPSPSLPLSLHLHRFVSILQTMAQLSLPSPRFFRLWFCFSELSSRKNF